MAQVQHYKYHDPAGFHRRVEAASEEEARQKVAQAGFSIEEGSLGLEEEGWFESGAMYDQAQLTEKGYDVAALQANADKVEAGTMTRDESNAAIKEQEADIAEKERIASIIPPFEPRKKKSSRANPLAGRAETKIVNGVRVDAKTGQPVQQSNEFSAGLALPQQNPAAASGAAPMSLAPAQSVQTPTQSTYTGPSIVDYLTSVGQPSDFASRARLAQQLGISGYTGTAAQNTKMLDTLRGGLGGGSTLGTPMTPPDITPAMDSDPIQEDRQQDEVRSYLDQVKDELGIGDINPPSKKQSPVTAFSDVYEQVFKQLGLNTIKKEFDKTQKSYDDLQEDKREEIAKINDDPWLTEGVRVTRIRKINEKYEIKESNLTNKLRLYDSMYQGGREDAKFVAQQTVAQTHAQQQFDQQLLLTAIGIAEKRAESDRDLQLQMLKMGEFDPSVYKEVQGGLYDTRSGQFVVAPDNFNPSDYKEVQGGLYNVKTGEWAIQPNPGGLTPGQIQSTVSQIAGQFDNEPIVKNFNVIAEGNQFAQALLKSGQTSANDIGLLYAFAKAMDPNSVVREGEYATVQKYAQSWAQTFGFKAERIFSNAPFLSEEARRNMASTIGTKYQASLQNYQNVKSEYERKIEEAKQGGVSGSLIDYGAAFNDFPVASGQSVDINNFDW